MKNLYKAILSAPALLAISLLVAGCNSTQKETEVFREYDLNKPEKFNLPESLFEVSGITFDKGQNDTVYAIQDEDGKLFRLAWDVPKQLNTKFAKKGDYEDLAIVRDRAYILKSNGSIFTFPMSEVFYGEPQGIAEVKGLLPKGEYEGMYGDETTGELYIICKNCAGDDSKNSVSGYILKTGSDSVITQSGSFAINVNQIKAINGKVARGFRPSGIAKNPSTREWYIISAVNQMIVVVDQQWNVKDVHHLNANMFIQPEGVAFDKAGNLYISNEGDDLFSGNVLKFRKSGH
ncbi:SdiA-regulated domain-containing protein [Dyadobacter sp. CY261]|uniref:SdiA-regulated domain-containing protein n=1 Tax=Dyadobacter sp. CY261 TaxID=2907203 RepID=UPI001F3371B2|nr:SdiA-regulated domain-containing protein [Dyadobacter sp. CY261]MCF0070605.1 SdiA-regulated domain-containing protein [Dyadobacter sp. CY261]